MMVARAPHAHRTWVDDGFSDDDDDGCGRSGYGASGDDDNAEAVAADTGADTTRRRRRAAGDAADDDAAAPRLKSVQMTTLEMVTLMPRFPLSAKSWAIPVSKTKQSLCMIAD